LSSARDVDAVLAPRQAGSTLKPFLYAQALDEKRLTAASLLDDAPINLAAGGGLYIPQNYDKDFKGWVSVRSALGGSLNVPAVRTLVLVTRKNAQLSPAACALYDMIVERATPCP
jgi:penicillin-binding protein 1C